MERWEQAAERAANAERLDAAQAAVLWREAPLWRLGQIAVARKRAVSGDKVYYNRNFHIEPTNLCVFNCRFCSYRRPKGSPEAWDMTMEQIEEKVRSYVGSGVTEVHIVGGVHPVHDIYYYCDMIRRVKSILPGAAVKAFTAIELSYMIRKAGLTTEQGLRLLIDAGMDAIPGGGAEIFDEEIRARICPDKGSTAEWFDDSMSEIGEVSVIDDLRTLAMSRLILDNVPHIKAYWVMYGRQTTEAALAFGADDIDGTIDDSTKIYSMAGADDSRPRMSEEQMREMVAHAGFRAVERDTLYNEIEK